MITGVNTKKIEKSINEKAIRKLLCCLFLYDEIFVRYEDYKKIIYFLGVEGTIELLSSGVIKLILDHGSFSNDTSKAEFNLFHLGYLVGLQHKEKKFCDLKHFNPKTQSYWRYLTDKNAIEIDYSKNINSKTSIISDEILADMNNPTISNFVEVGVNGSATLLDHVKILRVANIYDGLLIRDIIGADSIVQDEISIEYTKLKFSLAGNDDLIDAFSKLLNDKGIPDFYELYKKKALKMNDILNIRDKSDSCKFREWVNSIDYSSVDFYRKVLTQEQVGLLSKISRFIYPNIVGAINPYLGIATSALDSFLLDKLYKNWHPNVFIDDTLSNKIKEIESIYNKSKDIKLIDDYFSSVGRNETCPCGSGKKFKKCHGKY
ncbi:hypothetical protein AYI73_01000 [Shewanella algae]|nr:hypothetical protein AYI73_01000 [Shewanella algae]